MFGRLKDLWTSIRDRSRALRRSVRELAAQAIAAIANEIGRDEIFIAAALLLISAGFWDLWRPGAFLVPGSVLLWIALPPRAAFIERAGAKKE